MNNKFQSEWAIVSPFSAPSEELIGTGVTVTLHLSSPVAVDITLRKGEIDITFKLPENILSKGRSIEVISGKIVPYTVRKLVKSVDPINNGYDVQAILSGERLKKVKQNIYVMI